MNHEYDPSNWFMQPWQICHEAAYAQNKPKQGRAEQEITSQQYVFRLIIFPTHCYRYNGGDIK